MIEKRVTPQPGQLLCILARRGLLSILAGVLCITADQTIAAPMGALEITVVDSECDCGVWGDVNADGNVNPVDVVFMVNKVYLGWDMLTPHPNCHKHAADVNCDDNVNPVDVVFFVNKVYLGWDMFCPDPCWVYTSDLLNP